MTRSMDQQNCHAQAGKQERAGKIDGHWEGGGKIVNQRYAAASKVEPNLILFSSKASSVTISIGDKPGFETVLQIMAGSDRPLPFHG